MNRNDIIAMARDAGAGEPESLFGRTDYIVMTQHELERFAALVAATEAAKWIKGAKISVPTATMEQQFSVYHRRGYEAGAAAERERRAFELAECYRCGWDGGAAAEREKIAQSWDALHDQYMKDPLRRQMPLSYEIVANLIRGRA
ncbi:MAG: hypothetical protein EHM17_16130 [Verrucomicrobiaceae bacterium]|nr:MAG: hypothetical protein EHM17_16550 [Verrucomicrobiaceae bacterium]RPJ30748.1 MAG: hypothetical protein EHM17_16130 [Verrucomicrobiaceae bacterium]